MVDRGGSLRGVALVVTLSSMVVFPGLASASEGSPQPSVLSGDPLTLAFVANEGVMLTSGRSTILVDALFDRPNEEYRPPAPDVLGQIMTGKAPYDGVDLILVTHDHPDHFAPGLVARYLETFPSALLLAPSDAVEKLRVEAAWKNIEPRVVSLEVSVGQEARRDAGGVSVTAHRTLHSGGDESPANLVYVLELNGWRVFHEGDSAPSSNGCLGLDFGCDRIDLALVHFWFPLEPGCARFLQEDPRPDHVARMHLPIRLESDAPGKLAMVREGYRDIFLLLPGMSVKEFRKTG